MATASSALPIETERHRLYEDVLAIGLGTVMVSFGVILFAKAQLLIGSTAGLSLLVEYATGYGFWIVFPLINLPFYWLAVARLGWGFAIRSFIAVGLVSILTRVGMQWVQIAYVEPVYASVLGGCMIGMGLLALFRHRTGLGGVNIVAAYLQERFGIRAGYFQLGVDLVILAASFFVLPPGNIALSVLSAIVVNLIVGINHKPGRYLATS